jgi:hypothetical protein
MLQLLLVLSIEAILHCAVNVYYGNNLEKLSVEREPFDILLTAYLSSTENRYDNFTF